MKVYPIPPATEFNNDLKLKGFKVYAIGSEQVVKNYNRKDFYKICLVSGESVIEYADKGIRIKDTTLFFGTPHIPYSWEVISEDQKGYTCLFTEEFLKGGNQNESLQESPLFKVGGTPIFHISQEQRDFLAMIFQKMITEQETDYTFKRDLIRSYLDLVIHEALKMQPSENFYTPHNAATRITSLFLDLLERQFPIESTEKPLRLKSAQDFAAGLSVHVNYLNRSIKEVTGKPTTAHISERIIAEAKALLNHTDWNISEVGHALGFEYPTYFNNFFKKITGTNPSAFRSV